MPDASEKLTTPKALARRMGLHPSTVYRWIQTGRLPALRRAGGTGRLLIRESDAAALLQPADARRA